MGDAGHKLVISNLIENKLCPIIKGNKINIIIGFIYINNFDYIVEK